MYSWSTQCKSVKPSGTSWQRYHQFVTVSKAMLLLVLVLNVQNREIGQLCLELVCLGWKQYNANVRLRNKTQTCLLLLNNILIAARLLMVSFFCPHQSPTQYVKWTYWFQKHALIAEIVFYLLLLLKLYNIGSLLRGYTTTQLCICEWTAFSFGLRTHSTWSTTFALSSVWKFHLTPSYNHIESVFDKAFNNSQVLF